MDIHKKKKGKNVKMDPSHWDALARIGRDLGVVHDNSGNHSQLIREMVSAAVIRWQESPYICQKADYVVWVTREGHVFFRQEQLLKLNKKRERLPCLLEMKPEKRRDFFESKTIGKDEASWFRSHWLINYFGVWHDDELLDAHVDRRGIDVKQADLLVDQEPGSILRREIVVGATDYVQRRPKESRHEYDRVGFPLDLPTRNLRALVVVDLDLYKGGSRRTEEISKLKLEFRNRESARFEGDWISHDECNPMDSPREGAHLHGIPAPNSEEEMILNEIRSFKERIQVLAQSEVADGFVVPKEQRLALEDTLKIPEQFLYYGLGWPSPHLGVEVCVRWQKPEKMER